MKTLLKSAFILAFTAMVTSCDFFGKAPEEGKVVEKPATEIPGDSVGELNKTEEKKETDSASVQNDSTESKEKKETK